MKNTTLLKKMRKKTWAIVLTIFALLAYLSFLFIPTNPNKTDFLPYDGGKVLKGSLLNQIIYIFKNFDVNLFKNLNILQWATFILIGFMIFVLISSLISLCYRRRAIYKTNIFHAGLAIAVVLFYIIALMQQNKIANVQALFLDANNKFTFASPTFLPLMACVALVIAIISSFSAVHAKTLFRILLVAVACVSLAIFLFPVITKDTINFTFIQFFAKRGTLANINTFEQVTFITLAIAVLVNFILIVFYLGSRRFGPFIVIISILFTIIAITASILVFLTKSFEFFKNATMYVLLASIAQLILVCINAAISKKIVKKHKKIIVNKYENSNNDYDDIYFDKVNDTEKVQVSYTTNTEENDPTIIINEFESDEPLSKKERRKQEKLNKKAQKELAKQNVITVEEPKQDNEEKNKTTIIINEFENEEPLSKKERRKQEKLNKKLQKELAKQNAISAEPMQDKENELDEPLSKKERRKQEKLNKKLQKELAKQNAISAEPIQVKENELDEKELHVNEAPVEIPPIYMHPENHITEEPTPSTDVNVIDTTVPDEDDLLYTRGTRDAIRRESIRQRLEELKLNRKFIDEARKTINSLNTTEDLAENRRATELAAQNAYAQQELERMQMQKDLLDQQLQAQQRALQLQQPVQQVVEQPSVENDLSFLSVNPAYKNMTSAAYEDIPLTAEEERDPFIKTLTTPERLEFYANFLEPTNHKIPSYIIAGNNENFFDVIVVYIGSFAGKISFELMTKILDYSDTL